MTLRVPIGKARFLTLVNVFAPTMAYSDEDKDAFYRLLSKTIKRIPASDELILCLEMLMLELERTTLPSREISNCVSVL